MKKGFVTALLGALWMVSLQAQFFSKLQEIDETDSYYAWGVSFSVNSYPFVSYQAYPRLVYDPHLPMQEERSYIFPREAPLPATVNQRFPALTGFEAGLVFYWKWTRHWGLKIEALAERIPIDATELRVAAEETPHDTALYFRAPKHMAPWAFRLPLGVEYRLHTASRYTGLVRLGMDLGYVPQQTFEMFYAPYHRPESFSAGEDEPGPYIRVFEPYFQWNYRDNHRYFHADPYIALGWYYRFKWLLWETDLIYRHSLRTYYNGMYFAQHLNKGVFWGAFAQKGSYIGLRISWYLHKPNNPRAGAECPGQVHSKEVLKRREMEEKARRRAEELLKKQRKQAAKQRAKMDAKYKKRRRTRKRHKRKRRK